MAWCTESTSDDDLSFNLDSELAKASDSVSTPGKKSFGLQRHGKTVGGKDLKRTEKKAVRNSAQANAQGLGSYGKHCGVVPWKEPLAVTKVYSGRVGRGGGGAARSAMGGRQYQRQQQQQKPTPQRIVEKKQSPLTGLSGNRKGAAIIVPGASLGGCHAAGAAGIASRGAVRTKDDVQKTRENAKKKIEQAAWEKGVKHSSRWGDISATDGRWDVKGQGTQPKPARQVSTGKAMKGASGDVESPPKRRKVGDGTPQTSAPSPPELVTVDDSSSDEAPEEKEEGRGEGGNVMQQDAKDARAGGEGERREKDGEWCKQSPVTDWRSYDGERGDEKEGGVSTGAKSMFGTIPEFGADAVMIGSHVVASPCHMKINMGGRVTIALKIDDEDAKDTTLDIPEGDITFFGFSNGDERSSKPFVAIRTRATGKVARDPHLSRKYDPEDKGAAGLITVFLREERTFEDHVETIEDVLVSNRGGKLHEGMEVNFDMKGELPSILRSTLEKHLAAEADEEEALGGVRRRRTLRSGTESEDAGRLLLYYPPEMSAGDRVAVTVVDEARTQEGEFLNDSLIDLCLKHMHREALPSWEPRANGGQKMDGERIHILTSHFFTKLSETRLQNFAVAYSKVKQWSRNVDLFSKKFVFVPVVENMHWSLACLTNLNKIEVGKRGSDFESDEERPCMIFLDSLSMHQPTRIYGYLRRYLEEKWKEAGKGKISLQGETFPLVQPNAPTQINGCDCGVYVLRYAKEICQQWPQVTSAHVKNQLARYFEPELFGPKDIVDERRKLRELLGECKIRYEKEKHLRQEQKLSRCKDTSMAKDKDEGDGVEAEDGKRDIGIKPAPSPEPASGISRHGTRATVKIATKASAVLVSATAPAPALNQASSAAHDLAGVEGREGLVEPARAATAAAAVIASTDFSCVQTSGEAVVHAGEETSSLSRKGSVRDWGKEECASDSIDNDSNNRCNPATAAARRRRKTLETKETPGGGAKDDSGGDGDGVEEAAGEGAASSAPSRGETDDVARGGSGRTFNGMKAARRMKNATGKESSDRLAAAVASDAVGSGIASRSSSTTTTNNSVDDNVKGDREDTCSSILASKPSVGERELMDPSVSGVAGTVEDGDHAIYRSSVAARAGKEEGEEARHEDEEEGRQEPAEDGSLQTLDGTDLEDDGIEREQGTRAPIRRKKKLQPDLTTGRALTATVLADGSVAGEMPTNKEDGCRRKKVKDAGRKGAEAECSSVHNSEDKGPGEVVPISVGADAATNRPACTSTLDAEGSEGDGRRARNEGGQLGKGAKARSLEIEYSSVQQPDDERSVGAEAASDLFEDLSAIAQRTSPIRRRRNARSPTLDVGNATGGENNALAAQEEGVMKAFHASRKVPATPSTRQVLKGSLSPEQRVAQMLRLADDADLHEAMARSIKSVRSSTTSPVAPVVATTDKETIPRQPGRVDAARGEWQCTMLEEAKDVDVFASVGGRVGAEGGYTSDRSWTDVRQTDAQAFEISIAERMKVGVREGGRGGGRGARRGRGKGNMSHSVVSDGSVRLSPGERKMSGEAGNVPSPSGKARSRRKPLALEEVHVVQDCSGVIAATDGRASSSPRNRMREVHASEKLALVELVEEGCDADGKVETISKERKGDGKGAGRRGRKRLRPKVQAPLSDSDGDPSGGKSMGYGV